MVKEVEVVMDQVKVVEKEKAEKVEAVKKEVGSEVEMEEGEEV